METVDSHLTPFLYVASTLDDRFSDTIIHHTQPRGGVNVKRTRMGGFTPSIPWAKTHSRQLKTITFWVVQYFVRFSPQVCAYMPSLDPKTLNRAWSQAPGVSEPDALGFRKRDEVQHIFCPITSYTNLFLLFLMPVTASVEQIVALSAS